MLYNPTNMDIDHKGRIWVAEGVNYRRKAGRRPAGDRIVVLQDTNGDGKADKSHTFVQEKGLECPLGVAVFDNKVIVPQPPNLIVYTDVNRDLKFDPKVDKREVLLSGFNAGQHDHSLHSLTAGPDGKWYFNNGNCGAIFKDRSGKTFNMNGVYRGGGGKFFVDNHKLNGKKSDDGFLWTSGFSVRMNPDGTEAEIVGHGYRNSYEQSVNSFGDMYQNDNDDIGSCRNSYILEYGSAGFFTRDGQRTWRAVQRIGLGIGQAHWRQKDPGTFDVGDVYGLGSPTGNVFYENGALGDKWVGSYLACEPGRNTIFGYQPKPKGATFSMDRFDFATTNLKKQFIGGDFSKKIASLSQATDKGVLFRPSDVSVGPDGALYVVDWYDGRVGGHSTIDNTCSGAIYRIAPKGFKTKVPQLDLNSVKGQIAALQSPAVNVRHLGFNKLKAQGDKVYAPVLEAMAHPNKYVSARAVWLLAQLGPKGRAKVVSLLGSDDAEVKVVAYRALRRTDENMLPHARKLASDKDAHVRRDVALSLRHYPADKTADVFLTLVQYCDPTDKNSIEAIGLGAENKETAIWKALKAALVKGDKWSPVFAKITWRLWTPAAVSDLKRRALDMSLSLQERGQAVESLAFIDSKEAGLAMVEVAKAKTTEYKTSVFWLLIRGTGMWSKYGLREQLKAEGIYDPDKLVINSVTVPQPPKVNKLSVGNALKLKGDATKGKTTIMRCTMCHKINGVGPSYGPLLKGWGSTQSREAIVTSIIEPSADIAHGFRGQEMILKDGKVIHGLVMQGDPYIVSSTGGVTQLVPKKRVKSSKRMKRSLMLTAEQLGLTEQDVADIASYMQQWK